jgi:hypothetical protein
MRAGARTIAVQFVWATFAGCASAPALPPAADPVGVFDCTVSIEGQEIGAVLTIEEGDAGYQGTIASDMGTMAVAGIAVDGQDVSFTGETEDMAVAFDVTFAAGDGSFSGQFDAGEVGGGTIRGTRR